MEQAPGTEDRLASDGFLERVIAALEDSPVMEVSPTEADPRHGVARGVKWLVPVGALDDFEGGYECRCGEVFARSVLQGGMRAVSEALRAHRVEAAAVG